MTARPKRVLGAAWRQQAAHGGVHLLPAFPCPQKWGEGFAALYARAAGRLPSMADELIGITDNPKAEPAAVNRDRLTVDTRKWLLSKALPKVYGDRMESVNKHQMLDENEKPTDL